MKKKKLSAYQDPEFSSFWNEISGKNGQTYKQYVVVPAAFKLIGSMKNKTILDLGCGNGYLGPKYIKRGAKKVILMDISKENLIHAKRNNKSSKAYFLEQNALKKWKVPSNSMDIIYSDMMLNEVENINKPISECFRVLKKNGKLTFAVTHPAWNLFEYSTQLASGKKSKTLTKVGPYFFRGYSSFIMSTDTLNPKEKYKKKFHVEHFQRPLQDYFLALSKNGFVVNNFVEPELPERVLRQFPGYKKMTSFPIGAIFHCSKR